MGSTSTNVNISNCYRTDTVTVGDGGYLYGGLLGYVAGGTGVAISNSFWDTQTSGQVSSAGGTGEFTVDMTSNTIFNTAGWSGAIWNRDEFIQ